MIDLLLHCECATGFENLLQRECVTKTWSSRMQWKGTKAPRVWGMVLPENLLGFEGWLMMDFYRGLGL